MKARSILETVLYAGDLTAARQFYGKVMGLDLVQEVEGRFVFFRIGEAMLLIFNPTATAGQTGLIPAHGARGAGHVCFRATASEISQWSVHFAGHGVAIEADVTWPSGGRSLYVRDPAGNSVELAEARIWDLPDRRGLAGERVVIATHNRGKLAEFAELLAPYGINATSAGELGLAEPAETEATFRGNARIKAQAAMKASGLIAISDDSGLCVDALQGDPGVYTADWAGPARDWTMAMAKVEEKLQAAGARETAQRRASFHCTLCVMWPDGEERFYEGVAPGHLTWPPRGQLGHGYDPMFVPDGGDSTFAELAPEAKNRISHRARALEKLLRDLL
jgi:XTP/dITP diphosphohydrolase